MHGRSGQKCIKNPLRIVFYLNTSVPLLCFVAPSKVLDAVAEGEDKETDGSEEKTISKPSVKEEVETPELKVKTILPP